MEAGITDNFLNGFTGEHEYREMLPLEKSREERVMEKSEHMERMKNYLVTKYGENGAGDYMEAKISEA